ncbi:CheW protein [Methanocaldococcus villosus KIN24-T80]|uniref:CheW protein n=1 Tax=Methanocaldococcus villosus KIN24-T80 TaxID=1069083 RepID=N6UTE9_9EURY|nr:chemotaxis protein CheW [Methanocaldococcus villosus]ENN95574.1 CheW protein [Methanocaldococcus villosus KIN24-T80]
MGNENDVIKIVVFRLGKNEYGLKVDEVREVLKLKKSDITPLPNAPSYVVGVTNIRGEITPIINLKEVLGIYEEVENGKKDEKLVMVIEIDQQTFGILVDGVNDVMQITSDMITPVSAIKKSTLGGDYVEGIVKIENRLIILLNISNLLNLNQ